MEDFGDLFSDFFVAFFTMFQVPPRRSIGYGQPCLRQLLDRALGNGALGNYKGCGQSCLRQLPLGHTPKVTIPSQIPGKGRAPQCSEWDALAEPHSG